MCFLQFLKHFFCFFYHIGGHSCHFGYMNTETVFATALHELAQKENTSLDFLDRDRKILDTGKLVLHLIEFVIVSGKKGLGMGRVLM